MSNKSSQKTLSPNLRFSEFRNIPAWKEEPLGKFLDEYREKSTVQDEHEVLTSARDGLIRQKDYYGEGRITERDNVGFNVIPPNHITYRSRSDDRRFFFNENNLGITGIISTYYPVFTIKGGSNKFFLELCSRYAEEIGKRSVGNAQTVLSFNELKKIKLPIPKSDEQIKIADCLSSIDELIGLEALKLDALKDHKIGLLQQLFPAEGEDLPTLRFPEFRGAAGWIMKSGGDVFVQISNKKHDSNLPILAITQEHGAIPRDQINYHVSVSEKSIESYKIVEIGDFIISLRSFQGGIEYSKYKGLCSPAYVILRNKTKVLNCYFKHFFKTERFIRDMTKNIEGLRDGKMVSYKQFSELMLPFPPSEDEQRKIAECLSTADEMVAAQFQILETLKEHKKGLMQELFPSPKEVVG